MHPHFFDIFGVTPSGQAFEAVTWGMLCLLGVALVLRERRAGNPMSDALLVYVVGGAAAVSGCMLSLRALATGALVFGESGLILPTYGMVIAIGFSLAVAMSYRDAQRTPDAMSGEALIDMAFYVMVGSVVGARVLYVLTEFGMYRAMCVAPETVSWTHGKADCLAAFRFWEGGLVFYGGFIGGALTAYLWCRRNGERFLATGDIVLPYLAFGHALGRLGCVASGCCFGAVCDNAWAITFPEGSHAWTAHLAAADEAGRMALIDQGVSLPVHPVQLYEAAGELAIFAFLVFYLRPRKRFSGQLMVTWMGLYAGLRFATEMFRGDLGRGFLFSWSPDGLVEGLGLPAGTPLFLSTSQTIALVVMAACVAVVVRQRRGRSLHLAVVPVEAVGDSGDAAGARADD